MDLYVREGVREIENKRLTVCVFAQQGTKQGSHSHSFSNIRFSVSQSVRPPTDTMGFSGGTHAYMAYISLAEVNIKKSPKKYKKTNQTEPVMTASLLKIICGAHFG